MPRSFGIDYETGWEMDHDPQMRTEQEGDGICIWFGSVYPLSELERNGGLCPPCYYASLEPDPNDGELFEGEQEGGGDDAGKR